MPNPPFIDIHCHPEFKTFFSANEEVNRIDCWQNVILPGILQIVNRMLNNILESQASLTQLNNSNGTIGLAGLYAEEKSMIKGDFIRTFGIHFNLLTVAAFLELTGKHGKIDYKLLRRISSRKPNYFKLFKEVQDHLVKSKEINPTYKLLKNIDDYDPNKLNLIFTIEGGHNLFSRTCGRNLTGEVLDNLNTLKLNRDYKYLFLSITHMERNLLANHAYGMKILHHRKFKPVGKGITNLGKEVIKEALKKNPNRILIDIKHMSLEARRQYYEILDTEYRSEKIPIVVSHCGVTGVSYEKMPVRKCICCGRWSKVLYYKPEGLLDTHFNPWSINLYDEEIIKIVDSDGLIGLELDERILGTKQKKRAELIEYFSRKEFSCRRFREQHVVEGPLHGPEGELSEYEQLFNEFEESLKNYIRRVIRNPRRIADFQEMYNDITVLYNRLRAMDQDPIRLSSESDYDARHLCNNILHIVWIAGEKAWKHICIGSDFDGLIEAVECCRNATEYNKLEIQLLKWLPIMAQSIPRLPPIINIAQKVKDIMSGNAFEFLKRNFI